MFSEMWNGTWKEQTFGITVFSLSCLGLLSKNLNFQETSDWKGINLWMDLKIEQWLLK